MGIGLGTVVVIVIIVFAVMFLRRHWPAVMHPSPAQAGAGRNSPEGEAP
jgi:hypothetical protein